MKNITKEQEEFLNEYTIGTWKLNQKTGWVDVIGDFDCSNKDLSDFLGIEFGSIGGYFDCSHNKLVSLEGAPQKVSGDFICDPINLRGCPINLLNKIYFYNHKKNKIDEYLIKIINTLDPYLYFKKMI